MTTDYSIFHISDSALTIDFGNRVDEALNERVLALFNGLQHLPLPGMIEAVPAYSSLTIYYDIFQLRKRATSDKPVHEWFADLVHEYIATSVSPEKLPGEIISIPVCYDAAFGPDLITLASAKKLTPEEVIQLHTSPTYRVYMLGFLPGFAYMGGLDAKIMMPRKTQPVAVATGSVGIAGEQTGIYPIASPGGWSIIGRTPLTLFDIKKDRLTLLNAGDYVRFTPISKNEFENY